MKKVYKAILVKDSMSEEEAAGLQKAVKETWEKLHPGEEIICVTVPESTYHNPATWREFLQRIARLKQAEG